MERLTQKSSTIIIATDDDIRVFHSVEEIPPELRRKLAKSTAGTNAATLLIADQNGREEILRSLRGLPSDVRTRLLNALGFGRTQTAPAGAGWRWRCGVALAVAAGLTVALSMLLGR